jgi:hypothetical protein
MDVQDLIERAPEIVSIASALGIGLLTPLYLSQRRDVMRLREWMEREPGHAADDAAASEALLDRAETELEELLGVPAEAVAEGEPSPTPTAPLPAATRVTHDRPALERITIEREALLPHRRWHRFVARATRPRALVVIGIAALALGVGAIFASQQILSDGDEGVGGGGRIERADVRVSVLNGTSINGLAGAVGAEVRSNDYQLAEVTSTAPGVERTVVMYAEGEKAAAQKVARDLGLEPGQVEELDREARLLAGDAEVVVIAGEDRASRP